MGCALGRHCDPAPPDPSVRHFWHVDSILIEDENFTEVRFVQLRDSDALDVLSHVKGSQVFSSGVCTTPKPEEIKQKERTTTRLVCRGEIGV